MTADKPAAPRPAQDEDPRSGRMSGDDPPDDHAEDTDEKTDARRHRFRDWALI